jgi:hypothetical protein
MEEIMNDIKDETPIKTPVRFDEKTDQIYDADDRCIVDASETPLEMGSERLRHIAKCINEHADLAAEREKNEKLRFMIDNGLGWEDMVDDTLPGAPVVKRPSESLREKNARLTESLEQMVKRCDEVVHGEAPCVGGVRCAGCVALSIKLLAPADLAASAINKESE